MSNRKDLPESLIERVKMLEGILIAAATGGDFENDLYESLRQEVMNNSEIKSLVPSFVRTNRKLSAFWPFIRHEDSSYAGRRQFIHQAFNALIDRLENSDRSPGDTVISDALKSFDPEGVHAMWLKALDRRANDPEGAITIARTLLETVIKRILDELQQDYSDKDDLPKLYGKVATTLNLAPNQHSQEAIRAILGGATNLVNGIGTLRNRLSDSHGRGGRLPVRPSPRHASLSVNLAGAVATFLVETHLDRLDHDDDSA